MNPRSCIVSRQRLEKEQLIRFVLGPDNQVYADLKETLPGRGVWVEAKKSVVKKAVEARLFSKGFKQEAKADPGLADLIERLLAERALQGLAMVKKSGKLVTGFSKVDSAVRSNKVDLLLHANDAADDGKRKLASATAFVRHMGGEEIKTTSLWSCEEMSSVLGLGNVMHAAAAPGGATRNLIASIRKLENYRNQTPAEPN